MTVKIAVNGQKDNTAMLAATVNPTNGIIVHSRGQTLPLGKLLLRVTASSGRVSAFSIAWW